MNMAAKNSSAASAADGGAAALQLISMDNTDVLYEDDMTDTSIPDIQKITKQNNVLPTWGNAHSMNLNALLLENIVSSPYFKNYLIEVTSFQQIVEELYYNVTHLEPWERGTRKTTGMTGMCGGVRGVGAGGVVSTAFCLLYKMFTMKLTRKQLVSLINHSDSPYIRGMGFMYIRFSQPPTDLWAWMEPYLDDDEPIDPRSGHGDEMTIGQVVKLMLTKLDWYGTLFPRIPVPIQKEVEQKFRERQKKFVDDAIKRMPKEERDILMQKREEDREEAAKEKDGRRVRSRSPRSSGTVAGGDRSRDDERRRSHSREKRTGAADDGRSGQRSKDRDTVDRHRRHHGFYKCKHHLRHHHCRKHKRNCPTTKVTKKSGSDRQSTASSSSTQRHDRSTIMALRQQPYHIKD